MFSDKSLNETFIKKILNEIKIVADNNQVSFSLYKHELTSYRLPFCFRLSIKLNGYNLSSWGSGVTEDEASYKALAELIERIIVRNSSPYTFKKYKVFAKNESIAQIRKNHPEAENWIGTTTSGSAIHKNEKNAKEAALNELIERHIILKALAEEIPPQEVIAPMLTKNYKLPQKVNYFAWHGPLDRKVVVQQIASKTGYMYSFGCSVDLEIAKEKAFLEGVGMMIFLNNSRKDYYLNEDSSKVDMGEIQRFHILNKDTEASEIFNRNVDFIVKVDPDISQDAFYFAKYIVPSTFKSIRPLVAYRCISPLLQPLFFDHWSDRVVNPLAISTNNFPKELHIVS
ncbi:MAG: hypothetical protein HON90_00835 [Halobacteriovoraceae bacterium]|jgi:ribosomal protein S12 methylthiotransferase accessory factor YcaO|nr:hypothetical protein [Halobacteriovoraceae bacterium]